MNIDQNKKGELESLGVKFIPVNINELKVKFPNINYEINATSNAINKIEYNNINITIGDRYICDVNNYKIDYKVNKIHISKSNPKEVHLRESEYNTTSMFILPLVFDCKDSASYIANNVGYLLNCFVDCNFIQAKDKYSIFLLMKFSKSERFKLHEEYFTNMTTFVNKEDVTEKYVIYEFSIPDKLKEDFDLLLDGKYSKISKLAKNCILRFHGKEVEGVMANKIIERDPDLIKDYTDNLGINFDEIGELYKKLDENDILTKDLL